MLVKRLLLFAFASLLASTVSVLIILAIGKIPVPLEGTDQNSVHEYLEESKDQVYSEAEIEESARISRSGIEKKISAAKERERNMSFHELMEPVKQRAVYVTWLPWLIIPFLISIKRNAWFLSLLLIPALLALIGVFSVIEVLLFGAGIAAGLWASDVLGVHPRLGA